MPEARLIAPAPQLATLAPRTSVATATVPAHASQMYSRNLQTFVEYAAQEAGLVTGTDDPIAGPMCVTHAGEVRYRRPE